MIHKDSSMLRVTNPRLVSMKNHTNRICKLHRNFSSIGAVRMRHPGDQPSYGFVYELIMFQCRRNPMENEERAFRPPRARERETRPGSVDARGLENTW